VIEGAQHRTVSRDGLTLSVLEAGERSQPTLVFVHGYPDTKEVWLPVIELLAPEFHVVAYDVRGAGSSSAPRGPAAYAIDRLAADFAAVCDAVAPGERVHLVGHDWGGVQGWEFVTASRFEGRIASFTTIAGPALGHVVDARTGEFGRVSQQREWKLQLLNDRCSAGGIVTGDEAREGRITSCPRVRGLQRAKPVRHSS